MTPRPRPLDDRIRNLINAKPPELVALKLSEIEGLDTDLIGDQLPVLARPAPKFLTEEGALAYCLRAPIWLRKRSNGLFVIGNVDSWLIAQSALKSDARIYALVFGRSSHWFRLAEALERWLIPLLRVTPKDQAGALVEALILSENIPLIDPRAISDNAIALHTGESRDTIARRRKRIGGGLN